MTKKFKVNHTLWGRAMSTLSRPELREMCETFNIDHKGMGRDDMGLRLARLINVCGNRMVLVCDFDDPILSDNSQDDS